MISSQPIDLTIEIISRGTLTLLRWRSEILDGRDTDFIAPYQPDELPTVVKALDAVRKTQVSTNQELAILRRYELWQESEIYSHVIPQVGQHIGKQIYKALGADGHEIIQQTISYARHTGRSINYILRFTSESVTLAALPWELLHNGHHFLLMRPGADDCFERNILFGQALPEALAEGEIPHVLVLLPHFKMQASERDAQLEIFKTLSQRGALTYDTISPLTTEALDTYFRTAQRRPDIVHYSGHGDYQDQQGWLLFDGVNTERQKIGADQFSASIGNVKLAVILACQSAMISDGILLSGVAPALSYTSRSVIAMQFSIELKAAQRFAAVLYDELLLKAQPLRTGMARARRSLFGADVERDISWFIPTLYLQIPLQFTRSQVILNQIASERRIVRVPAPEIHINSITAGVLELTLARNPSSGRWMLVISNTSTENVEFLIIAIEKLPPGIYISPSKIEIPRVETQGTIVRDDLRLVIDVKITTSLLPIRINYRVRGVNKVQRYSTAFEIQITSQG